MASFNPTDELPCGGFVVELGGEFNSEYGTLAAALSAGLELKNKYSQAPVKVYDRTPAGLPEQRKAG